MSKLEVTVARKTSLRGHEKEILERKQTQKGAHTLLGDFVS